MSNSKKDILFDVKGEICRYSRDNPNVTQKELCEIFSKKYDRKFPASTMSTILKQKDKYLLSDNSTLFRKRECKYPELEEALHLYYCDIRAHHLPINDEMLILKVIKKYLILNKYF